MGGLDDYLMKTPDCKLFSNVASKLKWQVRDRALWRAHWIINNIVYPY